MTDLIEKVARAIGDIQHNYGDGCICWTAQARAAIAVVLREMKTNLPTAQFALPEYYDWIARENEIELNPPSSARTGPRSPASKASED